MTVRGRLLAAAIVGFAALSPAAAEAGVLELVKRACLGEPLPYGREVQTATAGERSILLSPGDPVYDQSLSLLPAALTGWSAGKPKIEVFSRHALGCGFSIAREDRSGDKTLIFSLTFAAAVREMRDELAKPEPDVTPPERIFEIKGRKGYDRLRTEDANLVLAVGGMALSINGTATETEKRALLDAADLDAIQAFRF